MYLTIVLLIANSIFFKIESFNSKVDISLAELLVSRGRIENQRGMLDKANLVGNVNRTF